MSRRLLSLLLATVLAGCTVGMDRPARDAAPGTGDSGSLADAATPLLDAGPPIECLRTFEWDANLSTPEYDFRVVIHVDQAGHSLRSETRAADGSLMSASSFSNEGNTTLESRDAGGDGTVESRERTTREYDAFARLVQLTIDRTDDAFVDAALTYSYEDTSHRLARYDQHETYVDHAPVDTFAIFTSDMHGRLVTEEIHLSSGAVDRAVFVYSDPVSPAHVESTLDRGSDGTPDIRLRIDLDEGCELEIGPEDILI